MKEQFYLMVAPDLLNVVAALLGLACAMLVLACHKGAAYLKKAAANLDDEAARNVAWNAIDRVDEAAEVIVTKIEQTTASALREAVKQGTANKAELLALANKAYRELRNTVGQDVLDVLYKTFGDVENYLYSVIEAKVRKLKQ